MSKIIPTMKMNRNSLVFIISRAYSAEISSTRLPLKDQNTPITNGPVYLKKETQMDAGIFKGQLTFRIQTNTSTNSLLLRQDYWKWVLDFIETMSHRQEMDNAQIKALDLMDELQCANDAKTQLEKNLENVRCDLIQNFIQKDLELASRASIDYLRHVAKEEKLRIEENRLLKAVNDANSDVSQIYEEFCQAVLESYEAEKLHSRFLRASIFLGILLALISTSAAWYIYNYHLIRKTIAAGDTIKELNDRISNKNPPVVNVNRQSWGSYLKDYVRPLYNWAIPKK